MAMLEGKAVVITGSGRGIGAACAKGAARQGASVVVNDVDATLVDETVAAITEAGGTAIACVADITDWEQAGRLIDRCIAAFGKIDGLVNNAALFHRSRLDQYDPAVARALVDVNVIGTLNCAARAVKPMLAQGSGSIVNLTSNTHMGSPPYGIYAATKGAVASLVYTWAMELAGTGIRVNALSPFGATRMVLASFDDAEAQRVHAAFPRPEANSPVVEYLLSDAAAGVNGQMVLIRGQEVYLYAHPALMVPPATRSEWTAEALADAFADEFKDRLVRCGDAGMAHPPVDLRGNWTRAAST